MNKKLLAYLLTLFLTIPSLSLKGQALTGTTVDGETTSIIEKGGFSTDFEIVAKSLIHNNTNDRLSLNWVRVENNLPDGWISLVCDPILCYGPNQDNSPTSVVVDPGGSMLLDLHFQAAGIDGDGITKMHIWAPADSANINLSMTYMCDAYAVNIEENLASQINVYPNPVRNNLTLDIGLETNVRYVEVYSLIGRKMAHYTIPNNTSIYSINASALPEGLYFVKMLNQNFEQIATKSFAKD